MSRPDNWSGTRIFTVGHSTRTAVELIALLETFGISVLADIRTIPRSRHNPQFNTDALASSLRSARLGYVHLPELGGLRHARKDSINTGWRNASFRGFADYMLTGEFADGLEKLRALTVEGRVAIMCAEAVPWRCHRSLVADALTVRGALVEHITGPARSSPHHMTPFAHVTGLRVTYPGDGDEAGRLVTRPPFHLEATVRVLQRRPSNLVDVWEDERYLRVLEANGELVLVEVRNHGAIDDPDVRFVARSSDPSPAARATLASTLGRMLGLDVDQAPLQRLAEADARLRPTARALRGMRPPRFAGLFETFANVVPFQQLSLDSGVATVGRLIDRFGAEVEHDGRRFHAFPSSGAIAGARLAALRACGLSARKAETLQRLAMAVEAGEITAEGISVLSTDDALKTLVELPGIGPWSAALVLLRGFGRLDVFPPGDTGVARGLGTLMQLEPGTSLDPIVERFASRRGYLYLCSLGGSLVARGLITPAPKRADAGHRRQASRGRSRSPR